MSSVGELSLSSDLSYIARRLWDVLYWRAVRWLILLRSELCADAIIAYALADERFLAGLIDRERMASAKGLAGVALAALTRGDKL